MVNFKNIISRQTLKTLIIALIGGASGGIFTQFFYTSNLKSAYKTDIVRENYRYYNKIIGFSILGSKAKSTYNIFRFADFDPKTANKIVTDSTIFYPGIVPTDTITIVVPTIVVDSALRALWLNDLNQIIRDKDFINVGVLMDILNLKILVDSYPLPPPRSRDWKGEEIEWSNPEFIARFDSINDKLYNSCTKIINLENYSR